MGTGVTVEVGQRPDNDQTQIEPCSLPSWKHKPSIVEGGRVGFSVFRDGQDDP